MALGRQPSPPRPAGSAARDRLLRAGTLLLGGWLVAVLSGVAATADAAEVRGTTHGEAAEVYLRLEPTERVRVGQELRGKPAGRSRRAWRVKILEVVGRRARARLVDGPLPRRGDAGAALATQSAPGAAGKAGGVSSSAPAAPWRVGRARIGRAPTSLTEAAWARLRDDPRSLVVSKRGRQLAGAATNVKGDLAFVGIGLIDLKGRKTWTFATLRSRLAVRSVGGTPLSWSHDLSLRYDGISTEPGRSQGGARARSAVAVRRARLGWRTGWGELGAGRLVMATGASGRLIDGASAHVNLGPWGTVSAWGGTAADPVSLALQLDAGRFGVGWRAAHRRGNLQTRWSLGYAGQLVEGHLDPHRLDAWLRLEHDQRGEIDAAATVAVGSADLSGTALAHLTTPSAALARLWLSAATRRGAGGWLLRTRYSYHRPTADRLIARTLPWDVWVDGRSHLLSLEADRAASRGWWLRPSLNAAWLTSPEPYDGLRLAVALRAGLRGERWSPHAAVHAETGLAFTDDGRAAGPTRGVGGWLGTGYALNRVWRLQGRAGVRYDQILPIHNGALRLRSSASLEWLSGPWLVALQVGNDTLLAADPTPGSYKLDWVDVTLLVRRRL